MATIMGPLADFAEQGANADAKTRRDAERMLDEIADGAIALANYRISKGANPATAGRYAADDLIAALELDKLFPQLAPDALPGPSSQRATDTEPEAGAEPDAGTEPGAETVPLPDPPDDLSFEDDGLFDDEEDGIDSEDEEAAASLVGKIRSFRETLINEGDDETAVAKESLPFSPCGSNGEAVSPNQVFGGCPGAGCLPKRQPPRRRPKTTGTLEI